MSQCRSHQVNVAATKGILLDDVRKRRQLYERLRLPFDQSVDVEAMEAFYADV